MIFKGARSRYLRNFFYISLITTSKLQIGRAAVFYRQNQCHKKSRMFPDRKNDDFLQIELGLMQSILIFSNFALPCPFLSVMSLSPVQS